MKSGVVAPGTLERIRAVLAHRALYELGGTITWDKTVGRPNLHAPYELLAFATLARLTRSTTRVQTDLADPVMWDFVTAQMREAIAGYGLDLPAPARLAPRWHHWSWLRDHQLATDEGLVQLARTYTPLAVAAARELGLLDPHGPGSFTHPDRSRCVYGDQTSIRPMYRPPEAVRLTEDDGSVRIAYPDPRTGVLLNHPPRAKYDPDLELYHGLEGSSLTHGYVSFHTRGNHPYQRVILAIGHSPGLGQEVPTALDLVAALHRAAGEGIQAVIYDRAFHGVHVNEVMTRFGYLGITKMPDAADTEDIATLAAVRAPDGHKVRSFPLGPLAHTGPTGAECVHQLAAINGGVVEIDLDETGDPVVVQQALRGAVKRSRRATGSFHFNVGYQLDCTNGPVTAWLSPHPGPAGDLARPHHLRVIPPRDPDFDRLHGLREDAESTHSQLKRTLIVNRQMSVGWRRGMVDLYCFALYNNAITAYRAGLAEQQRGQLRGRGRSDTRSLGGTR